MHVRLLNSELRFLSMNGISGRPYSVRHPSLRFVPYKEARFGSADTGARLSPVKPPGVCAGIGSVGGSVPGKNAKRINDF